MNNYYIKKFDEEYSQSREAQLIQYLNQRGAQVPKLVSNHPHENTLKMEHVGDSLITVMEKNKIKKRFSSIEVLKILRESIQVSYDISELGVWHFDLALRNFTLSKSEKLNFSSIFLIDFSAAISDAFALQKPLWLRPDSNFHHKELLFALENDWINFFQSNFLNIPKIINNEFTIPIHIYNNYWNSSLSVQEIKNPACVISHSLGIMANQFLSNYPDLLVDITDKKIKKLKEVSCTLKNLDSSKKAQSKILEILESLDLLISASGNSSGITPRPKLLQKEYTQNKIRKFDTFFKNNTLALFVLAFGFVATDITYRYNNISLSDYAYYISLAAMLLPFLCFFLVSMVGNFKIIFKTFLRIESLILLFYFFELLLNQADSFFLVFILFASLLTVFLVL